MAKETLAEKQARLKQAAVLWADSLYKYELIARAINVDVETLRDWRSADQDFSDQLEEKRVGFLKKHINKSKSEFLLERLDPENFKQRTESELRVKELPTPILGGQSVQSDNSNSQDTSA